MVGDPHGIRMTCRDTSVCVTAVWPVEQIDRLLGALCVDPVDLTELTWGWERFGEAEPGEPFEGLEYLDPDAPWPSDPGHQIRIDLPRRSVLIDTPMIEAEHTLAVSVSCVTSRGTEQRLRCPCSIPWTWLVISDPVDWQALVSLRRPREPEQAPGRFRRVLYREVVPYIVNALAEARLAERTQDGRWRAPSDWIWEQLPQRASRLGGPRVEDLVAEWHARWLMSPREDLGGDSPRALMLRHLEWVDHDLETRATQWARTQRQPAGLRVASSAYQAPVFGSHEFLLYYDWVREMTRLAAAWFLVSDDRDHDFLIRALLHRQETWARSPDLLFPRGPSAAEIIDLERRRIPLTVQSEQVIEPCECPICQMISESGEVGFQYLDDQGHDWDWPFSSITNAEHWRDVYGDYYEIFSECATFSFAEVGGKSLVQSVDFSSWSTAELLLHVATHFADGLREICDERVKMLVRDDFTQLYDAVLDPGWQSSAPIIGRLVDLLSQGAIGAAHFTMDTASTITCLETIGTRLADAELDRIPATD